MSEIIRVHAREILDSTGQPHRRGGGHAVVGNHRQGVGALRGLHGRARGPGASRRQQGALPGQGRPEGRPERHPEDRPRARRDGRLRAAPARLHDDRARRDGDQARPRGKRHPRRVAGLRPGGRRENRDAPVPLHRRGLCQGHPRPACEYHQRRDARRQQRGHPGVHDHARRRPELPRGDPHVRRGLPQPALGPQGEGLQHRRGRRGRFCAQPEVQRGGPGPHRRGDQEGRLRARRQRLHRPGLRRPAPSTGRASTSWRPRKSPRRTPRRW